MTLSDISWLVGQYVPIDRYESEFESLLNHAQKRWFEENHEDEDAIYPFIKHMGRHNNTVPLKVSSLGLATLPEDFAKHRDFTVMFQGHEEQVERVESWEFSHRLHHSIETPTAEYPIGCYFGTQIKFEPKNIQFVNFTYISKPPDVVYATKEQNGMKVYDPDNSVELLWDEQNQIEVVRLLLEQLGVIVSSEQIKQKKEEK